MVVVTVVDGRTPARGAQPRGDHRRAARLLRRRDPAAERARGRRPRRRVGALGAQPLRRRRGAAGRGRAAAVGAVRAAWRRDRRRRSRSRSASRSSSTSAPRSSRRSRRCAAPRCCRCHDSPTIAAQPRAARPHAAAPARARRSPASTPDALDAVDALASWDTWNRLRAAQGCSVAARPPRFVIARHSHNSPKGTRR